MDNFVYKSDIKTEFPDSPPSGQEDKHSLLPSGPDIKPFIKTENYQHNDLWKSEPGTSKHVKQTGNVNETVTSKYDSSKYQYDNYNSELKAVLYELSNESNVNETEVKEEKLFHFQDSLDIKKEDKAEPVNFDLSTKENQKLDVERVEFDQGIFFDY